MGNATSSPKRSARNATSSSSEIITRDDLDRWRRIFFEDNPNWTSFHPEGKNAKPQLEKCLVGFCFKHVDEQKPRWAQKSAIAFEAKHPPDVGADETDKKIRAQRKRAFVESSLSMEKTDYYSWTFDPALADPNSKILKEYRDFVLCAYDAKKLKEAYWTLGDRPSMDNLHGNELPEFMRLFRNYYLELGKNDDETLAELLDIYNTLANKKGLTIRILFVTLAQNDTEENRKALAWNNWIAKGLGSTYGLNHLGLQIGPYYVHWDAGGLVRIQRLHSNSAFAMFYPNQEVSLKLDDEETIDKLCNLIVSYNKSKYSKITRNCQHFVEEVLKAVGCEKSWIPGGPIEQFLKHVANLEVGVHTLRCWNLDGKTAYTFNNYIEFKNSCSKVKYLVELLAQLKHTDEEKELVDVLKAIERAYIASGSVPDNSELVFPLTGTFMYTPFNKN